MQEIDQSALYCVNKFGNINILLPGILTSIWVQCHLSPDEMESWGNAAKLQVVQVVEVVQVVQVQVFKMDPISLLLSSSAPCQLSPSMSPPQPRWGREVQEILCAAYAVQALVRMGEATA